MRNRLGLLPLGMIFCVVAAGCGQSASSGPAATTPSSAQASTASKPVSSASAPAAASAVSTKPSPAGAASGAPASAAPSGSAGPQAAGQFSGGDPNGSPVRVSYPSPAVSEMPYYAALSQGFFQQQRIKITQYMMAPNVSITALSKGEIDIVDSPGLAIEGASRGLPFKVIFTAWQRASWTLIGKQQVKSLAELKGKTIGTNQVGSVPYFYLEAGLKKAGLSVSDVKIASSNATILTYQSLIAGQIDAAVVSPPFDAQADSAGFHEIQFLGDLLELPYIGAGSSVSFLAAHRDETVRFLRALIEANRWIKGHPAEATDLIVKYVGAPPDAAKRSVEKMIPNLHQDSFEPSPIGLQQALDINAQLTNTKSDLKPEQVVDYGPLHQALGKA